MVLVRNAQHSSLAANNAHIESAMPVAPLALSDTGNKDANVESNVLSAPPGHGTRWWML
jgi:phage I-like protein